MSNLTIKGPCRPTPDAPEGGDYAILDGDGQLVAECFYRSSPTHTHDAKGRAALFAAAPDLLAACNAMVEWDDREKDHAVSFNERMALCDKAFNLARAAIAKAEAQS
jgi:hypothetical protein